jgi:hypothetical protein
LPAVFLITGAPRFPISVKGFAELTPSQRLCLANVVRPIAWPADRLNKPSCLAKREVNASDPGPGALQGQLKWGEISPLFQITGTQNITLKGAMQTGNRFAPRWAACKVDAKNIHA